MPRPPNPVIKSSSTEQARISRSSQILIGIVSGVLGAIVFLVGLNQVPGQMPPQSVLFLLSASAICISIACFSEKSRPVTMRLIGVILVVAGASSLFISPSGPDAKPVPIGVYVFAAFLAAGGAWLAVTGKYPSWGAHGRIFEAMEAANAKKKPKRKRTRKSI